MDTLLVPCPICNAPAGAVCRAAGRVGKLRDRHADHPGRVEAAQLAAIRSNRAAELRASALATLGWEPEGQEPGDVYASSTAELVMWANELKRLRIWK